jgi:hypothetical protein
MKFINKSFLIEAKSTLLALVNRCCKDPLKYLLITSIVLITAIKLNLIGAGFLSFLDEFRYTTSGKALEYVSDVKIGAALNTIFSTEGRPADAILNIIPNAIQLATAHIFNLNYYESTNSYPLFIFNFIIYCFILIVHFKFSKFVLKDSFLALISVLVFGSLTNSYLYLRHALPYDASLLIFYLVIYKTFKYTEGERLLFRKSFLLGIFSFLGYLVYPGYFPLFVVGLFILFFNNLAKEGLFKKIYHSGYYILGSIFCLFIFEALSRIGGRSYISDALHLSSTVYQGSFEESFSFIVKYLYEVEGLAGVILIFGSILFCLIIIHRIKNKTAKQHSHIQLLGYSIIGLFIAYASAGYFLHTMVFYGRLLHQYFPFICIFSLFSINEVIKNTRNNRLILFVISLVFIVNFSMNFIHYKSFSYPRDVAWKLSKTIYLEDIENVCEVNNSWSLMPSYKEYAHSNVHVKRDRQQFHTILVTNCCAVCSGISPAIYHAFNPNENYNLLDTKPHFINFKAYQYEGYNISDRKNIDKINLQIRVFAKREIQSK